MSQPDWLLAWYTDCQALYTDTTGVYEAELSILDDNGDGTYAVYRVALEGLKAVFDGERWLVVEDHYAPDHLYPASRYRPWYWQRLPSAARCSGLSTMALVRLLLSTYTYDRACAYNVLAGYFGWHNFDYPETWTETEAAEWPDRGPAEEDSDADL
jgi:hypothetical protein